MGTQQVTSVCSMLDSSAVLDASEVSEMQVGGASTSKANGQDADSSAGCSKGASEVDEEDEEEEEEEDSDEVCCLCANERSLASQSASHAKDQYILSQTVQLERC